MQTIPHQNNPLSPNPAPRGMAVMAVVMMFVLIGAAVISMSLLFAAEVRRTRAAATGAQLRQLLLAGTLAAQTELQSHPLTDRDLPIPLPLEDAQLRLHLSPTPTGATAKILATFHHTQSTQQIQFTHHPDNTWSPTQATITE